ncbi:MAG: ATP-grasp domain-containing protein, partial [Firmicutes bacterium]|nr:ATP-grasp domain-containing protein [Bacillota bacterium]
VLNSISILDKERIQGVFVASSNELAFYSNRKAEIEAATGVIVFTNPPDVLKVCQDKWRTVTFLKEHGFHFPHTIRYPEDRDQISKFIRQVEFPIVVKPRFGTGSKDLFIVENYSKLRSLVTSRKNLILQQYLPDDDGEFTTGICTGANEKVLSGITLKRLLQDGLTMAADCGDYEGITDYCKTVARTLKTYGPCNFQSRLLEGKPYIFEINPRFSSSTGMRCLLGVNEAEILLRSEILKEDLSEPEIIKCGVIRQYADYLVPVDQIKKLEKEKYAVNDHG